MHTAKRFHIIIFGGAGFIGTNTTLEALKRGYDVTVFDSFIRKGTEDNARLLESKAETEEYPGRLRIIRGDIRNVEDLQRIRTVSECIINFAANPGVPWSMQYPQYDFHTNATAVQNLLEFARFQGRIPFIQASTNKVYSDLVNEIPMKESVSRYEWDAEGNSETFFKLYDNMRVASEFAESGISEDFPVDSFAQFPHSPYGVSKLSADMMCQEYHFQYDMPIVVNRMSCVYGVHQKGVEDQGWTWWFVKAKYKNEPLNIFGDGKQVRDVMFGADVARLYIDQAEMLRDGKLKFGVYNVGGGMKNNISLLELIDHLDSKYPGEKLKINLKDWRPADQKIYISDTSKVESEIGWTQQVDWKEGIDRIWSELIALDGKGLL